MLSVAADVVFLVDTSDSFGFARRDWLSDTATDLHTSLVNDFEIARRYGIVRYSSSGSGIFGHSQLMDQDTTLPDG